jgi:hypothetical protein
VTTLALESFTVARGERDVVRDVGLEIRHVDVKWVVLGKCV